MAIAQVLVAGADVWLNTPLPPLEASARADESGGQRSAQSQHARWLVGRRLIEGVTGWSIEDGTDARTALRQARAGRAAALLRGSTHWIWMMKQAISKIACYFNSHRMMRRYAAEAYLR